METAEQKTILSLKDHLRSTNDALADLTKRYVQKCSELDMFMKASKKAVETACAQVNELEVYLKEIRVNIESTLKDLYDKNSINKDGISKVMDSIPFTEIIDQKVLEIRKANVGS